MIPGFNRKIVKITPPAVIVDNAAYTTTEIDTYGCTYAIINVHFGATDIAMVALKVQESDTSGSGFTDVTGLVSGTSNNDAGSTSTLPASTADNTFYGFFIDLRGRKRYLDLVATAGDGAAGTYMTAWAELYGPQYDLPVTAAERGYAECLTA